MKFKENKSISATLDFSNRANQVFIIYKIAESHKKVAFMFLVFHHFGWHKTSNHHPKVAKFELTFTTKA